MSWFPEEKRSWLEKICVKTLKLGPIPNHMAFIMDGNRRFAKKLNMRHIQGHMCGFEKLAQTLEWCLDLGITEVTVYAFSIENFKRSKEEVDALMELARSKFQNLLEEQTKLDKYGVCIRVFGNISLLPKDVQKLVADAVLLTSKNNKAFLNVCLAYTAREEICSAIQDLAVGVSDGLLKSEDISEDLISQCLYTSNSPDPNLLVRTSGEVRLSDYLLWQSSFSVLAFFRVLWPEFSIWHLFLAVIFYQYNSPYVQKAKLKYFVKLKDDQDRRDLFLAKIEYAKEIDCADKEFIQIPNEKLEEYVTSRRNRCSKFLLSLQVKRRKYLEAISASNTQEISPSGVSVIQNS